MVGSAQADVGQGQNRVRVAILIEINPLTGQGLFIGNTRDEETPGECGRAPDLTYDPATDTLFTVEFQCEGFSENVLMQINQNTG